MTLPYRIARLARSARTWFVLGVLAPIGMLAVSALMLEDLRRDAWDRATQMSQNVLQIVERDIARNIEIIDLSLQGIVESLNTPGVDTLNPTLRQLVLFDRAATAKDLGVLLVVDENGDSIVDAAAWPPRPVNYADRDYFQAHRLHRDLGLVISRPVISKLTRTRIVVLSRRINKPNGAFGGIALITLKLSYFEDLLAHIDLGHEGAVNLYLRDGTRIMRYPGVEGDIGANLAGAPTFERFARDAKGTFVGTSVRDGVERYYAFTTVGRWPLIVNVALSVHEIEAEWRTKACTIAAVVGALCALTITLAFLFSRELRRRAVVEVELARLSLTDTLTGLPNRRRFEEALASATQHARSSGAPLSLLVVDADHFKRYNDRYGHAVGDEVLKALGRCLAASVYRPPDLVCRVGGEEFVILLPDTDQAGASRIAARVHASVANLTVAAAGLGAGSVTISIGLAWGSDGDLLARADAALYEAKAGGRNQTRCAAPAHVGSATEEWRPRLVVS